MTRFPSVRHLISWAGFCLRLDESAGKRRATRTRQSAPWLFRNTSSRVSRLVKRAPLLLVPFGRGASPLAVVRRDAAPDLGDASGLTGKRLTEVSLAKRRHGGRGVGKMPGNRGLPSIPRWIRAEPPGARELETACDDDLEYLDACGGGV
jgi:Transposase IS116/IS110/IS902 family